MFLKTLRAQTTDEQKELFTKPAERYEIIGEFLSPLEIWSFATVVLRHRIAYSSSLTRL